MKILIIILIVLAALYIAATLALFILGFCRFRGNKSPKVTSDDSTGKAWQAYADVIRAGGDWFRAQGPENVEIRAFDGLRLRALLLPCEDSRGVIIFMHGYRSTPLRDLGASAQYYHDLGFTLLLPNQRACGDSDGRVITFGAKESRDVKAWTEYAAARFGGDTPIIVGGISLGCSSVLMSLGLGLPAGVKAAVADCGYSSLYDELTLAAHNFFKIRRPAWVLWGLNIWCRLLGGFDIRSCSTLDAMRSDTVPVLFIHGDADDFVPCRFSRENYEACAAPKELFIVPGAEHGLSYLVDTPGYHRHIEDFLDKYCPKTEKAYEN